MLLQGRERGKERDARYTEVFIAFILSKTVEIDGHFMIVAGYTSFARVKSRAGGCHRAQV